MIRIKNHNQLEIFDPWSFMSPIRRSILDQSWSGLFKEEILCELPVSKFKTFFNEGFGRPTKELHTALGMLILQQAFDLTDKETSDQLSYNIQWHYALNISEESDSAKYVCPKTLWNIRNIVIENGLESSLFECTTNKLAAVFKVNTGKQRIDSVHIQSNMRRLGRIGIFAKSIHRFLVNLKRGHKELFDSVEESILDRYFSEQALGCFAMVKPSEARHTLISVADDLFDLIERFKYYSQIASMHSYKLLERVLKEQCNLNVSNDSKPVEIKKPKEIPSDSLQNPSDPDASYSGHKGQGYQVQVMETYTDTED
ncbi:MAG: transposase, partial [Desulfobacterales bacterium]